MLNTLYCIANKQTKTRKSFKIKEKKKKIRKEFQNLYKLKSLTAYKLSKTLIILHHHRDF